MTAGDNNEDTFNQPLSYFHIISRVLGGKEMGTYLAGGCTSCENIACNINLEHLERLSNGIDSIIRKPILLHGITSFHDIPAVYSLLCWM